MKQTKGAIGNLLNRYKAVLKKCHLLNTFGSLAVVSMLVMGGASPAMANQIALEGQNDVNPAEVTQADNLMGGWLIDQTHTTVGTGSVQMGIVGIQASEIIGGSYVRGTLTSDAPVTIAHDSITTTIGNGEGESGATSAAQFVVGGSKIANGSNYHLQTGAIDLTINGGTFGIADEEGVATGKYELVVAGNYIKGAQNIGSISSAHADSVNLKINGGTFDATVVGGSVANVYGTAPAADSGIPEVSQIVSDGSTSTVITGGIFNPSKTALTNADGAFNLEAAVIGGGMAYGVHTEIVHNGSSTVSVSGNATDVNGKIVAGTVVADGGIGTFTGDSSLTANGGTYNDDLVGGGMVDNEGDEAFEYGDQIALTVNGSTFVTMNAGTLNGEITGAAYVRGDGAAIQNGNSSVTVSGGEQKDATNKGQYIIGGGKAMAYNGDIATTTVTGTSSVTVEDGTISGGAVVGGSFAKATGTGTATARVAESSVDVYGGTLAGVIGGSMAESYSIDSSTGTATASVANGSRVTVTDGTIGKIKIGAVAGNAGTIDASVVGGSLANGAATTANAADTWVSIEGGKVTEKVVGGSAAANGAHVTAGNTHIELSAGTVTSDLVGGNFIDVTEDSNARDFTTGGNNSVESTYVEYSGGRVEGDIIGGSYIRNASAESTVTGDTHVVISASVVQNESQDWVEYVVGGGKAMTSNDVTGAGATANVDGTAYVTIRGGADTTVGLVAGGGFTRLQAGGASATAKVNNTVVNVEGGTLAGVTGGGIAENRDTNTSGTATSDASVTQSTLNITGGTINAAKYASVNSGVTPTYNIAVVGAGVAYSGGGKANASVTTAVTNISGTDTKITGDVLAAGLAHGSGASVGGAENAPTTAALNMNGGTVEGDVFAGGAAIGDGAKAEYMNVTAAINAGTVTGNVYAGNYTGVDSQTAATGSDIGVEIGSGAEVQGNVQALTARTDILIHEGARINTKALEDETITDAGVLVDTSATDTTVTLDGDNAARGVANGFESAATSSTLAFANFTGANAVDFNFKGFSDLEAMGDSKVNLGDFNTAEHATENQDITLTGDGTFVADSVTATTENTLTVGNTTDTTTLQVNKSLSTGDALTVSNLGTLAVNKDVVLETAEDGSLTVKDTVGSTTVNAGGTYQINGLESVAVDDLANLKAELMGEDSAGLFNVGAATITGLDDIKNEHGHYAYDKLAGSTANDLLDKIVDVTDEQADDVQGGFQAVHIYSENGTTATEVGTHGTLQLAGSEDGGYLVSTGLGETLAKADLRIGDNSSEEGTSDASVTLGREGYNNKGELGNVILNAGHNYKATLNVIGDGEAYFKVGDIRANYSDNSINVTGAHLVTGKITADTGIEDLDQLTVTKGSVTAEGNAEIKDVDLREDSTVAAVSGGEGTDTGKLTISGILTGYGKVFAGDTLTIDSYTGTDDDNLTWEAPTVQINDVLDSTKGTVHVVATDTLNTTGAVTLVEDTVRAAKWNPSDAITATDTVIQIGQFGTEETGSSFNESVAMNGTSIFVHGDTSEEALNEAREAIADAGNTGATYYAKATMNLGSEGTLHLNATEEQVSSNAIVFGSGSMLVVDSEAFRGKETAVFTSTSTKNAYVDAGSKLYAVNVQYGDKFTVFGDAITPNGAWTDENVLSDTPMLKGSYNDETHTASYEVVKDPVKEFPGLSGDLAPAVYDLYANRLNDVNDPALGVRFLSRATNDAYLGGSDRRAAASTIESAARMAFAGAVPQMTKMASDSATNSVVNRMGFANPENGAKAMNVDGKLVDDKALGLALWIAPLWSNQTGFGMEAGNLDYGYNANLGGISLGADYTWANNFRAGLMFNIGGGYAESSGDLSETTNSMTFWGVGAYGGWKYENFAVMGDVSYTSTWNSVDQDVDHRMQMGDLESDIQASAISAGLRFEYKLETQYLDLIPHVGARYMSINTWGYDVDSANGTILEGDGFQQNIWTFPVGITFSKELEMKNDWYFKPSVDFTVIPAAGDIKAKEDVLFTGMQRSYEVETQMMDYFTWQGGLGLEFGNDNMSVGVNYTLQAGQNSTGHGVFGMFRYEF